MLNASQILKPGVWVCKRRFDVSVLFNLTLSLPLLVMILNDGRLKSTVRDCAGKKDGAVKKFTVSGTQRHQNDSTHD